MPEIKNTIRTPPFATVAYILGFLVAVLAAAMLIPTFAAVAEGNPNVAASFALTALGTAFVGGGLMFAMQGTQRQASTREQIALVVVAWTILPFFGCLPFLASGTVTGFTDAYFEATASLTTTGSTVLPGTDVSVAISLWRALLSWLGGYGSVLMAATVLSALGTSGEAIHRTLLPVGMEGPRLMRFARAARDLFVFYVIASAVGTVLLWFGGVPGVDAICLALSAISTAGLFAPQVESVGPFAEVVLVILMLAGATSFLVHWQIFRGQTSAYLRDPEMRLLALMCGLTLSAFLFLRAISHGLAALPGDWDVFLFNAISVVTTTAYWRGGESFISPGLQLTAIAVALVGGASLSTAGGLKLIRFGLLVEQGRGELRRLAHPRSVVRVRYAGRALESTVMLGVWSFFAGYLAIFAFAAVGLTAFGLDLMNAVTAAGGALANAGRLYDLVSSDVWARANGYAVLPDGAKWILVIVMIAGRLEVLALLSLFSPAYWRR